MVKKTSQDIKVEAAELLGLITRMRKKDHNFALMLGKEGGVVLAADPKKSASAMWRQAKANGGSSKGCMGVASLKGKLIQFYPEGGEEPPKALYLKTKKHLKDLGLAFKVAFVLPDGAVVGGEDDEDAGEPTPKGTEAEADAAAVTPKDEGEGSARAAELKQQIQELSHKVAALTKSGHAAAGKLVSGLKSAFAALGSGKLETAEAVISKVALALDKIGDVTKQSTNDTTSENGAATRKQLETAFGPIAQNLDKLKDEASDKIAQKADQLATMFWQVLDAGDWKKAVSILKLTKAFAEKEVAALAKQAGAQVSKTTSGFTSGVSDFLDDIADAARDPAQKVSETVEKIAEAASDMAAVARERVDDFVDSLTEDGRKKLELQALGFSEGDQDRIVAALATNPNAMRDAKAGLVDGMDITPDQKTALKSIAGGNPRTFEAMRNLATTDLVSFAAATATMAELDVDGTLDVTPTGVQSTRDARVAAHAAQGFAEEAIKTSKSALDALKSGPAPGSSWETAQKTAADAEKTWAEFNAALPEPADMNEDQRQEAMRRGMELDRIRKDAAQAVEVAKATNKAAAEKLLTDAQAALTKAKDDQAAAIETLKAQDAKRGMLDALTFGRLSSGAKPQIASEDKAKFLEVFAKDGQLARNALDLAAHSPDPSVIAQNAGFVVGKMLDGFATPSGDKLNLRGADMRNIATNALRMGAREGQSYFDGLSKYLDSGKQLQPDPHGGLSTPLLDPGQERLRKNGIALSRTQTLSAAVIDDKGKVNFSLKKAEAAMEHMKFHPGSLTHYTPQMTDKMNEVRTLFTADATKAQAQDVIDGTSLPDAGANGRKNALKLVVGTTGKGVGDVRSADAKASVLAAMMTPLSQGPVGSCFSTAPVRGIRETDPIRAMTQFSALVSTGIYTTPAGKTYPANVNPPKGENPLMRSWEYSVATAAAELATSRERKKLSDALGKVETFAGIEKLKFISDDKWKSKRDSDTGMIVPGVSAKLLTAINHQLKFEYNAGPEVGAAGGGGDGSSTDGGYQVAFKGNPLANEADFIEAMKDIALTATGYSAESDEGKAVIAVIKNPKFADTILNSYSKPDAKKQRKDRVAPWNMSSGGFEDQTQRVLHGGTPSMENMLGKTGLLTSRSDRTKGVVGEILGLGASKPTDMTLVSTRGEKANHAFNALPGHPSQDKIRDPDSDAKIEKELIEPGRTLASTRLPTDQTARIYDDQLRALLPGASADMRDLISEAFKRRPTEPMTPRELKTKVETELETYKAAKAQRRADDWIAKNRPTANATQKRRVLDHFLKQVDSSTSEDIHAALMEALPVPEVVIADTNWGGPEGQVYFVAAPDPVSGELVMWRKDVVTGRMTLAGKNWEDCNWYEIKG